MSPVAQSRWRLSGPADPATTRELATVLHIPEQLAALLVQRGVDDIETAKVFLRPSLDGLSDPAQFRDLPKAAAIIAEAVRRKETIMSQVFTFPDSGDLHRCVKQGVKDKMNGIHKGQIVKGNKPSLNIPLNLFSLIQLILGGSIRGIPASTALFCKFISRDTITAIAPN